MKYITILAIFLIPYMSMAQSHQQPLEEPLFLRELIPPLLVETNSSNNDAGNWIEKANNKCSSPSSNGSLKNNCGKNLVTKFLDGLRFAADEVQKTTVE